MRNSQHDKFFALFDKTQQFGFFVSCHLRHLKNSWNRIWRQIKSSVCCLHKNVQNFAFNIIMQTPVSSFFCDFYRRDESFWKIPSLNFEDAKILKGIIKSAYVVDLIIMHLSKSSFSSGVDLCSFCKKLPSLSCPQAFFPWGHHQSNIHS